MKEKNTTSALVIGGPTILMVFIVLCLVTFALLSLLSANSEYHFTRKAAEVTRGYYAADSQGEVLLQSLQMVCDRPIQAAGPAMQAMLEEEGRQAQWNEATSLLAFSLPINEVQFLQIGLQLQSGSGGGTVFRIDQWQMQRLETPEEEGDHHLSVLQ